MPYKNSKLKAYKCKKCSRRFMSMLKRTHCSKCVTAKGKWPRDLLNQHNRTVTKMNSKFKQYGYSVG